MPFGCSAVGHSVSESPLRYKILLPQSGSGLAVCSVQCWEDKVAAELLIWTPLCQFQLALLPRRKTG